MLVKIGTLVYIQNKKLQAAERYGVVVEAANGKLLVQKLLSEEAEMLTINQSDVKIVFSPPPEVKDEGYVRRVG